MHTLKPGLGSIYSNLHVIMAYEKTHSIILYETDSVMFLCFAEFTGFKAYLSESSIIGFD